MYAVESMFSTMPTLNGVQSDRVDEVRTVARNRAQFEKVLNNGMDNIYKNNQNYYCKKMQKTVC